VVLVFFQADLRGDFQTWSRADFREAQGAIVVFCRRTSQPVFKLGVVEISAKRRGQTDRIAET
jgi:hypothetical protein